MSSDRPVRHLTPVPVPAPRAPLDIDVLVRRTASLLEAGIPLTLLLDLAEPGGPHSSAVYAVEGGASDWTGGRCSDTGDSDVGWSWTGQHARSA